MRPYLYAVLAAATLAAAPAHANASEVTIRIDLSDLDIADPSDVEAIRDRIDSSVTRACRLGARMSTGSGAVAQCKADGTAKAFEELSLRRARIAAVD